jgi:acyl transferase domain-containing protein
MLWSGTDAISEIPADRWPLADWFDEGTDTPGKMYTRFGGFLNEVDRFDADFFGIAPVEAAAMDPQQRLVLELAWEGLEDAGHAPSSLAGTRAGVYLGIANGDYGRALFSRPDQIDPYFSVGTAFSVAAGRVSYVLGLHGPAVAVDTACSSSLVSLHLACQGLRNGDCDLALAGGVNLILTPEINVNFSKAGMMSRDGRCRTFDADAAGYVRGEGGGMLVLRRLRDAVADGDRILAVVRGTAVNQDGRSNGLTAPNGPSQEAVVRAALRAAGVSPAAVGYVETHGTGTSLGDPIEVNALGAVLAEGRDAASPVAIGSVKTNIGHLEAAAGVAGVIKAVLALQHGEIPPHLHFATPNPLIDWDTLPVTVPTAVAPFPAVDGKRVAAVSSFGFSGTNAHVILESAPAEAPPADALPERPLQVLAISARDAQALRTLVERYRDVLRSWTDGPAGTVADLCATANAGRSHFAHRVSVSGATAAELAEGLEAWLGGGAHPRVVAGVAAESPRVAFLFPGQGSQYAGMGRELYDAAPAFREAFDACAAALDPLLDRPVRDVVQDGALLDQTEYAQPALFAIEYALAQLWRSWGVEPAAVMGHSFGEYAAAAVAGVLSLPDAARMVVARGRLAAALPPGGSMAIVEASETEAREAIAALGAAVWVAAINAPATTAISGERAGVETVVEHFAAKGRRVKRLARVSYASHSPLVEPMLDAFERELSGVRFAAPTIGVISNLTGEPADLATLGTPRYWRDHLRHPVRFAQSVRALAAQGITHYVEPSPHPVLLGMAAESANGASLPSLREGQGAWSEMLLSLQALYAGGVAVDWTGFERGRRRRRVALPTYPFRRRRFWHESLGAAASAPNSAAVDLWSTLPAALDRAAAQGPLDLNAPSYPAKWASLSRLADALAAHTLAELGAFRAAGERHTLDSLMTATGIVSTQRRLVGRWLERLERAGMLTRDGDAYVATGSRPDGDLAALWVEVDALFVDNREMLAYVRNCAQRLVGIMTGRESALESLFPDGSFELATGLYERSATMRYVNGLAASTLAAIERAMPAGRTLRVLEIGAGTGGTTTSLLPVLPVGRVRYRFTDVSDVFLDTARQRLGGHPQLEFGLLDLDKDPAEQGYEPGAFDVIVAANAVHAVKDLRAALMRIKTLLAPGGAVVLVESTTHLDYFDFTTGLIEGWQHFADDLRGDNPLIAPEAWSDALREAGFAHAGAWPGRGTVADALGQHVVVACVPGLAAGAGAAPNASAEATEGAAAPSAAAPADDLLARIAEAPASERTELLVGVVRSELARALRVAEPETLDRRRRLTEFGIDSLMAVQLRNRLAAALHLAAPLPATLIFDHPTIDALAQYLERDVLGYRADAASTPAPNDADADAAARRAQELEALSDEEVEALLLRRLQSL